MFSSLLSACAAFIWFSSAHAQEVDYLDRIDRERLASGEIHLGLFLNGQRDGSFHLAGSLTAMTSTPLTANAGVAGNLRDNDVGAANDLARAC